MKELKRSGKIVLRKTKKMFFWLKAEIVILHDGNVDGTKSSLYHCLGLSRVMVLRSFFSVPRKVSYKLEKMEKIQKKFSLLYLLKKTRT